MQGRSIHDNRVFSYEVDGEHRRITLHTRFGEREPFEYTDVIFEGVFAYHFENDNFGNILFGIEQVDVAQLVDGYRKHFEEGAKYGWPGPWNVSIEACIDHLGSNGARAFEISSSYGLDGWVIAGSQRVEALPGPSAV